MRRVVVQIDISRDIRKMDALGLLPRLTDDKTTGRGILWGTDAYAYQGSSYEKDHEIKADLITGQNAELIQTRASKAMAAQSERTRQRAEVFTPIWVCRQMNDQADDVWFGRKNAFFVEATPTEVVDFTDTPGWKKYVDSRRMEITCGEGPFLVSRYDADTGEIIPVQDRVGMLDRKLRVVSENAASEEEWVKWAIRAVESVYGFEFQGDNLLIARINVLMTFAEYMQQRWGREPTLAEYRKVANTVAWNLWQMDGLTGTIPYAYVQDEPQYIQESLFDGMEEDFPVEPKNPQPRCTIYDWRAREPLLYQTRLDENEKEKRGKAAT